MTPFLAYAITQLILLLVLRRTLISYRNRASTDAQAIQQMTMIIDFYQGRTTQPPTTIQPDLFENLT